MEADFIKARINKTKKAFFSIQNTGTRGIPLSPAIMSRAYWSKCIPILTHGTEIMPLSDKSLQTLEQAHGDMAKLSQGLPSQTANVSCLATLGWKRLSSYIEILRLLFLWRLLLLPVTCVYKQVAIMRLHHHMYSPHASIHKGPLNQILQTFRQYGLIDVLDEALTTGKVLPLHKFKSLIQNISSELETDSFQITCHVYKSLKLFKECISTIEMWSWWIFASKFPQHGNKVRLMCRLLMDRHCLKEVTCYYDKSTAKCLHCTENAVESVCHMLFKCSAFNMLRNTLWEKVLEQAPQAMQEELGSMNDHEKTVFIFSGLNCKFTVEWEELYVSLINFCYKIYQVRQQTD
jgi:hypothetical protein